MGKRLMNLIPEVVTWGENEGDRSEVAGIYMETRDIQYTDGSVGLSHTIMSDGSLLAINGTVVLDRGFHMMERGASVSIKWLGRQRKGGGRSLHTFTMEAEVDDPTTDPDPIEVDSQTGEILNS